MQDRIRIGIIGAGNRGVTCLGREIAEQCAERDLEITALCNRGEERMLVAAEELGKLAATHGRRFSPKCYRQAAELVAAEDVDVILVTTPTSAHREAAVLALESGKKVYLDKPIAHTLEDSRAIVEAESRCSNPMLMGFTRRYEAPWRKLREVVESGLIGTPRMMQIRSIVPYHLYFHTWHRTRASSGGALNDKASHYADVFNWFADAPAEAVNAFGGRNVFHARTDAPPYCAECSKDCPYRAELVGERGQDQVRSAVDSTFDVGDDPLRRKDNCVFKPGADILDHASVHFRYANGIVASLFYSIYGPAAEDEETFEVVGTRGRAILTRHTGSVDVVTTDGRHEVLECKSEAFERSHFGADRQLVSDLAAFARGASPVVTGFHGYEATRMILAALDSVDQNGETIRL